ncbi:AGAP003196-PA-like protein [Anopheles sinensis]|uniref:Elongation of very long chain fatty acids protein n=1 Tax=Anopheles sinensis TaxID=74873 RepID=A0A084VAK4_ANOSI|nr:AGAP003196-PA-like protein [Anopheles sinensis]
MAVILQAIYNVYQEYIIDKTDERVANLPLLRSVWTVPLITGAYLYFVLRCGPKWMSCRKPVEIRSLLIVYNLVQVVANAVAFTLGLKYLRDFPYSFLCQPIQLDGSEQFMAEMKLGYIYFLLKVLDLSDTVFFVLRKKQSHVSFLHVYHHTVMVLSSAFFLRYLCGGHAFVLGLLNTFVHAVMYGYFFLSIYWPEVTRGASWKRYITLLQMAQFSYLVFHFFRPIILGVECGYPRAVMWFIGTQNVFMMLMFGDFYWRTYVKKPRAHHT